MACERVFRCALGAAATALLVAGLGLSPRAADAEEDVPLPLTGRPTVHASPKRYVIDGKQVIPAGSAIRVESGVRIVGINHASLEIKGGLQIHGIPGTRVQISGVDFSPTLAPDSEVHFDEADLSGCTFVHPEGAAFVGGLAMENVSFTGGTFAVRIRSGYLKLMSAKIYVACTIDSVPGKGKAAEVSIRSSMLGTLRLSGDSSATVRDSELGETMHAKNFTDLLVDACDLKNGITLEQDAEGTFSKLKLQNCNLLGGSKVVLRRPVGPKTTPEKVRLMKFFFGRSDDKPDMTDKEIADRIDDGADDPQVSVKAIWPNPKDRAH